YNPRMKDNNVEATGPNPGETPKPHFKNRAERNKGFKTLAQEIFGGREMINERPEGMSKEEYRILRKIQSTVLKQLFHKGKSPSRKLQGIMRPKQPTVRFVPKRRITQRKQG